MRVRLTRDFPGVTFYTIPADIVSQILDFGLPAPIDIQIVGRNLDANRAFADQLFNELKYVPGTVDLRIQQVFDQPKLHIDVNRTKAQEIGFSQLNVAQNVLISLSGSYQTQPTFWLDPQYRRELQHRHANSAVSRRSLAEAREYLDFSVEFATSAILADVAASIVARKWGLFRITTCSR